MDSDGYSCKMEDLFEQGVIKKNINCDKMNNI
jgi:hypothetical protein